MYFLLQVHPEETTSTWANRFTLSCAQLASFCFFFHLHFLLVEASQHMCFSKTITSSGHGLFLFYCWFKKK
ncbi:hypothetical protein PRUPE_1G510500 [Prunus persica]|uniref:Uncharacterized protein n=1 Tax=Prunus persica TaxID=3760 RepID=A0A251RG35_PRUPE|nr:hypothetical protein PRUPE_1G510500 [Prunus persica]